MFLILNTNFLGENNERQKRDIPFIIYVLAIIGIMGFGVLAAFVPNATEIAIFAIVTILFIYISIMIALMCGIIIVDKQKEVAKKQKHK